MSNKRHLCRGRYSSLPWLAALCVVSGCEFLPGTNAYDIERAKRTATSSLIDPSTAQFRDVQKHGDWVCGELNAKNRMGAFVGFKRFVVRLDVDEAQLDPEFRFTDLIEAQDLCQSLMNSTYPSMSSTLSACDRASEQRVSQALQSTFDAAWANHCLPVRAKSPFRPTLNDPIAERPQAEEESAVGSNESVPATRTNGHDSEGDPVRTAAPTSGTMDQIELDRIFKSSPPKTEMTPSEESKNSLDPPQE